MTKERRQQAAFAVLLGILVVLAGRFLVGRFDGRGAGGTTATGGLGTGDGSSIAQVVELRTAELEIEAETFQLGRDPFRFVAEAPPPPPPPAPAPAPEPARVVQMPPRQTAPAAPKPPPIDVVYLGRFGPSSRPIAVFSDGKEIFNAREGGVLKGSFVVDKIGYESADLRFVGFPDAPSQRLAAGG